MSDLGSDTRSDDLETALAAPHAGLGVVLMVSDRRSDTNDQHHLRTEPHALLAAKTSSPWLARAINFAASPKLAAGVRTLATFRLRTLHVRRAFVGAA